MTESSSRWSRAAPVAGPGQNDHVVDWDGAEYRRVNGLQRWLADRALQELDLAGVGSVLDVGCGDGRITAEVAARIPGGRVVGIDPSPRMIAVAPSSDNLSFEIGDVLALPYVAEFDLVTSFNALHWVHDQGAALSRIATALATPGRALLVFVCGGDRPSLEDVAMQTSAGGRWSQYFEGFAAPYVHPQPDQWADVARSAGLDVDQLEVDDLDWDFETRETFVRWCAVGFGAWTSRLADDGPAFVSEVVDAYAEVAGSDHTFRFMQLRANLR
jgi:trans-aconitate 2-methyltransferase